MAQLQVPSFKLNTGAVIPGLGFGSGTYCDHEQIKSAVLHAIKLGYRHFDTAGYYGTEASIGGALAEAFEARLVQRKDVFITTKLKHEDHGFEDVLPALQKSLNLLKLDYVDLYLIHAPIRAVKGSYFPPKESDFLPVDIPSTWKGMEDCFHRGLTRAIGVSNFSTKKLQDLLEHSKVRPAVNQVELHPVWQQNKLREFCRACDVQVIAWSPLGGMGKLWGSECVLKHPVIQELALKHNKSPAQVVLRWLTEIDVCVVAKSYNAARLSENIDSFDFKLTAEDHEKIKSISQKRLAMWPELCNSTTSPYRSPSELWDGEI